MLRRPIAGAVLCGLVAAAGCAREGGPITDAGDDLSGTVTVLAAASLTNAFEDVAAAFEARHPDVGVALSFDGSSALAAQIEEGVPADVFAAADERDLAAVADADLVAGDPVDIATNDLQIVVAEGNPLGIRGLADLTADLRLALCADEVPCGRYSAEAFDRAGLTTPEASAEENVRGVLTKVALGEADAGLVYVTDVAAADDVEGVALPEDHQVLATYPAAVLADAPNPEAATAFLAYLTDTEAQAILAAHGFGGP